MRTTEVQQPVLTTAQAQLFYYYDGADVERPYSSSVLTIPPAIRRIRSLGGMRKYLQKEHGMEFVPRSRVVIVPRKELEENTPYATYLRRHTIIDAFGPDHAARVAWQRQQEETVNPLLMNRVLVEGNQFTGNSITSVLTNAQWLVRKYTAPLELVKNLETLEREMYKDYIGEMPPDEMLLPFMERVQAVSLPEFGESLLSKALTEYGRERYRLLSCDEKLVIVHNLCTRIVASLWAIARYTNPSLEPIRMYITGKRRVARDTSQYT